MTRLELSRVADAILDIAESERGEDLKLEMIWFGGNWYGY